MNYDFEEAGAWVLGVDHELVRRERDAVKIFLKDWTTGEVLEEQGYADRIMNAVDTAIGESESAYRYVAHVSPTSNTVEQLFNKYKNTMSDRRQHMGPECLEATVISRINSDVWLYIDPWLCKRSCGQRIDKFVSAAISAITVGSDLAGDEDWTYFYNNCTMARVASDSSIVLQ